jgi:hypothetical protein
MSQAASRGEMPGKPWEFNIGTYFVCSVWAAKISAVVEHPCLVYYPHYLPATNDH